MNFVLCMPLWGNIDIDFRYAEVKIFVSVVPWGTVGQDVEM